MGWEDNRSATHPSPPTTPPSQPIVPSVYHPMSPYRNWMTNELAVSLLPSQNKYDSDVRRILTAIDARREAGSTESLAGPAGPNPTRPETCPQPTADRPTARGGQAQTSKGGSTGRSNALRSGGKRRSSSSRGGGGGGGGGSRTASDPSLLSVRSSTRQPGAGGVARTRPVSVDDAAGGPAAARPRRGGAPASRGALHEGPETPTPRPMIAGSAAMVAGGRKTARNKAPQAAGLGKAVFAAEGRLDAGGGGVISPSTAKKVLPHFLAIGNPGSQALVPKEGAEIVQRQVGGRHGERRGGGGVTLAGSDPPRDDTHLCVA